MQSYIDNSESILKKLNTKFYITYYKFLNEPTDVLSLGTFNKSDYHDNEYDV